jgi:hypothetical protein
LYQFPILDGFGRVCSHDKERHTEQGPP